MGFTCYDVLFENWLLIVNNYNVIDNHGWAIFGLNDFKWNGCWLVISPKTAIRIRFTHKNSPSLLFAYLLNTYNSDKTSHFCKFCLPCLRLCICLRHKTFELRHTIHQVAAPSTFNINDRASFVAINIIQNLSNNCIWHSYSLLDNKSNFILV